MSKCEHCFDHVTGTTFAKFISHALTTSYAYPDASTHADAPSWPFVQIPACQHVGSGESA